MRQGDARFALANSCTKTTSPATCHLITVYILYQHSTDMDLRDSISRPFKKLKHRLTKGNRKRKDGSKSDDNRGGGGDGAEGSEAGQSSYLHPETEDVAESRPSQEEKDGDSKKVVQVDPPASTPSISHRDSGKPNGM